MARGADGPAHESADSLHPPETACGGLLLPSCLAYSYCLLSMGRRVSTIKEEAREGASLYQVDQRAELGSGSSSASRHASHASIFTFWVSKTDSGAARLQNVDDRSTGARPNFAWSESLTRTAAAPLARHETTTTATTDSQQTRIPFTRASYAHGTHSLKPQGCLSAPSTADARYNYPAFCPWRNPQDGALD